MTQNKNRNNLKLGITLAALASISIACMNAFAKELGTSVSTPVLVLFRFLFSFICIIPWVVKDKNFSFKVDKPLHFAIRISSALLAMVCIFTALRRTSLTSVLLLSSTTPLFIPILAAIFFKIKTHTSIYLAIALGFVGVAIVLHPAEDISINSGELLATTAGILAAVALLEVRILSKTNTTLQILFYYYGVSALVTLIASLFQWSWPENYYHWLMILFVGITGTIYQISITIAISNAPSRIVTPLAFSSVIWGGSIEYFIWHQKPSLYAIIGFTIIIISILLVVHFGNKYIVLKR